MLRVIEEANRYATIDHNIKGNLHVYVDGSWSDEEKRGKHAMQTTTAGWCISNEAMKVKGYGVNVMFTLPSAKSEINEFRSMLSFFDVLYEHFPEYLNKDRKVFVYCDNVMLINMLRDGTHSETVSRRNYGIFGEEYTRMVYYISVMNLSFKWVKGHSDNNFNRFADNAAGKARRMVCDRIEFTGETRKKYLKEALINLGIAPLEDMGYKQAQKYLQRCSIHEIFSTRTIWLNASIDYYSRKNTLAGFSYTSNIPGVEGSRAINLARRATPEELDLRALRYALKDYKKTSAFKPDKNITVRLGSHISGTIISAIAKGKASNILRKNDFLNKEILALAEEMEGLKVLPLSDAFLTRFKQNQIKNQLKDTKHRIVLRDSKNALDAYKEHYAKHNPVKILKPVIKITV